jgi:hypothetical protein
LVNKGIDGIWKDCTCNCLLTGFSARVSKDLCPITLLLQGAFWMLTFFVMFDPLQQPRFTERRLQWSSFGMKLKASDLAQQQ